MFCQSIWVRKVSVLNWTIRTVAAEKATCLLSLRSARPLFGLIMDFVCPLTGEFAKACYEKGKRIFLCRIKKTVALNQAFVNNGGI